MKDVEDVEDAEDVEDVDVRCPCQCPAAQGGQLCKILNSWGYHVSQAQSVVNGARRMVTFAAKLGFMQA